MQITDVRIRKISTDSKMKAIVSVTFDGEFVVHDIKVIEGKNGLFIAMPSRKTPNGEFKDITHPINTDTRQKIQDAILSEYERVKSQISADENTLSEEIGE
ncbi:septation regulator SpoVG [Hathewaya limosa]|uniref:Putative septation protein SpoVG n=1 Tax=Hathewaya limosa TaxID=1536 RepID=A0ABU0JND9_HATLI|nr:septation regulator SpoVG [Hathewaya limosa]AWZ49606.1 septation protein SpoVG [Clostridiaceae bacterium 14S0207]MDQ0478594.1 stage V sporulation protein G [Hathewaya limosa]